MLGSEGGVDSLGEEERDTGEKTGFSCTEEETSCEETSKVSAPMSAPEITSRTSSP